MEPQELQEAFSKLCKFDHYLGMELKVYAPGHITYTLKVKEEHLTFPDACHGGVIAAMMDATLGLTALSWSIPKGSSLSTVEFKINYLSLARPEETIEGTGDIDFIGKSLMVVNAHIREVESDRLIAKGLGTFTRYPLAKKKDAFATMESEAQD